MPINADIPDGPDTRSIPTGPLRSGPVLGETGETYALVWVRGRDVMPLTLTVNHPGGKYFDFMITPEISRGLCAVFTVTGLTAGQTYECVITSILHGMSDTFTLRAGLPHSARKISIIHGSCLRDDGFGGLTDAVAFDQIVNEEPCDLFLMCGDNGYYAQEGPFAHASEMLLRQLQFRNNPKLRKVLAKVPTLGIWDDHDFGRDNEDSQTCSPGQRARAFEVFKDLWPQRLFGTATIEGIFSSVRCGPVEVFLTDGRYYRVTEHHILGNDQLENLKARLKASTAPIKLIVSGSVVLPEFVVPMTEIEVNIPGDGTTWDGWRRDAPIELESLLSHIESNDIRGVVFVSGDLHISYLMRRAGRPLAGGKIGPDQIESVSSPLLTPVWYPTVISSGVFDPGLLAEVPSRGYGRIDIDLDKPGKEITMALKSEGAVLLASSNFALDSLRVRPAPPPRLRGTIIYNDKAYFFKGKKFVRYTMDPLHEGVDRGYPAFPFRVWPDSGQGPWKHLAYWFKDGIDAAMVWPTDGKAYFFKDAAYVRYTLDQAHEGVDAGYPKYISETWPGVWITGVDAAVVWPNGFAYFFKGDEYIKYRIDPQGIVLGYPRRIQGAWPGLAEEFPDGIDAAVVWPNTGFAYFFRGADYVKYRISLNDPANEGVVSRATIAGPWPGLDRL